MNTQIVRLFGLSTLLLAVLVGFTSYWSIFDAEDLRNHVDNKRTVLQEQQIRRGTIFSDEGVALAKSRGRGSGANRFYAREYPSATAELMAHPVGYNFLNRERAGIELSHNDELVGEKAEFISILDQLRGHRQEGDDLRTNLDVDAQRTATQALGGRKGAVVAIEPDTGKVRVMVSIPSYDPNEIDDDAAYRALTRDESRPLFNRATQNGYEPGSTMKVVTATAALDSGRFTPSSQLSGRSPLEISGAPLENSGGQNFGTVDLTTALTQSINTVWAQVGEQLGTETMFKYMRRYGFFKDPPIDYPSGQLVPSGVFTEQGGRLLKFSESIDIGRVAVGQERLLTTPLQMAMVPAAIANGGVLMKPRLWAEVEDPDGRQVSKLEPVEQGRVMKKQTARELTEMMSNVVREGTGTAGALEGIDVAGKTGTAEAHGEEGEGNRAWFIAFAPVDDPKIAVAVVIELTSGQGGEEAAPIAKQVMESLTD